jgi:hypothetical protein
MFTAASASPSVPGLPQATVPVRSPRTSLILAELARQRRLERYQRRCKRQRRRRAWARWMGWLAASGRWPVEPSGTPGALGLIFHGTVPLVYALEP